MTRTREGNLANLLRRTCFILLLSGAPVGAAFELDEAEIQLPDLAREASGNPAHLAAAECWRWSFSYHLPFGLRELQFSATGVEGPVYGLGLGFQASSPGFHLHRETAFRLGVARSFGTTSAGVAVEHLWLQQRGKGARGFRRWVSAWRVRLTDHSTLGVSFTSKIDGISGSRWTLGLHQKLDGGGSVSVRTQQRTQKPRVTGITLLHAPHDQVAILLGTRSAPRRFALGVGLHRGILSLHQVVHTHNQLGPSHTTLLETTCRGR